MSAPFWDELAREHAALRAAVQAKRRDPVAQTLGQVVMAAVEEAEGLRAQGLGAEAVAAGLETAVRERWPKGREDEWRYLCETCHDYGWREFQCSGDAACGRHRRHGPHTYAEPCWCDKEGADGQAKDGDRRTPQIEDQKAGKLSGFRGKSGAILREIWS
jgi:hypothetical protein